MGKMFRLFFFSLWLACPAFLLGQIAQGQEVTGVAFSRVGFVKDTVAISPDELYFNVIKITNLSTSGQMIRLAVTLPNEWKLMSEVPVWIELPEGKTKPIPLRITIPKTVPAGLYYPVICRIFTPDNGEIASDTSCAVVYANRSWNLSVEQSTVYFQPGRIDAPFSFSVENRGNITEKIVLEYEVSEQLKLASGMNKPAGKITLAPRSDTTLNYSVLCSKYYLVTPFNNGQVTLTAATDLANKKQQFKYIRLPAEYDNYDNARILPLNVIGTQVRMYNTFTLPMVTTFLRGRIPVKKNQSVGYRIYTRDILKVTDFWQENDLELFYRTRNFEGGFGSSSTHLAKNLFLRNGLYAEYEQAMGKYNILYGFINRGIIDHSSGYALGHEVTVNNFTMLNSAGYSKNAILMAVTKSVRSQTALTFAPRNTINYQGTYYQTLNSGTEGADATNYEHRMNYNGTLTERITLNGYNEYRSLLSGVSALRMNSIRTSASVGYGKKGGSVSGIFALISNELGSPEAENPELKTDKVQYTLQFALPSIHRTRLIAGSGYSHLLQKNAGTALWESNAYNLFVKSAMNSTRLQYRATIQLGFLDAVISSHVLKRKLQKLALLNISRKAGQHSEYALNINYSDGIILGVNFNRALEERFTASANYRQALYKEFLALNVSAGYDHSTLRRDALMLNAALEGTLDNQLDMRIRSTFRSDNKSILSFSSIEASLSKGFDIGRRKTEFYNLTLVCFKDLNGNGKKEAREPGADNLQVSVKLVREDPLFDQAGHHVKFKNVALLSGKEGTVEARYLPAGEYEIHLLPLADMGGFFNFSGAHQTLYLKENKTLFVAFIQAARIYGVVEARKSSFSQTGIVDLGNIRITARDEEGNAYNVLTDKSGNFTLYVPKNRSYVVSVNEVLAKSFILRENNIAVSMKAKDKEEVNFIFEEKKRRINF